MHAKLPRWLSDMVWHAITTGRAVAGLVREFLEFFSLDYTASVFDPETGSVSKMSITYAYHYRVGLFCSRTG